MERIYTIPLRDVKKAPRGRRAEKAVRYVRAFMEKHMKSSDVRLDPSFNEKLWERGMRNIPPRIRVKAEKREDGSVLVSLAE
jgi:large subunit ribosomal protein L31e